MCRCRERVQRRVIFGQLLENKRDNESLPQIIRGGIIVSTIRMYVNSAELLLKLPQDDFCSAPANIN